MLTENINVKATINKDKFKNALKLALNAIAKKPIQPILGGVKLELKNQTIKVCGYDLALGIEIFIEAEKVDKENEEETKSIIAPAKLLYKVVEAINEEEIQLEYDEENLIIIGESGTQKINCFNVEEYPENPEIEGDKYKIKSHSLFQGYRKTKICASEDSSKPMLCGINIKIKEESLKFAATDGHKLGVYSLKVDELQKLNGEENTEEKEVTIPLRLLNEAEKINKQFGIKDESIILELDTEQVAIHFKNGKIFSRAYQEKYPDYEKVFPETYTKESTASKFELNNSLNVASLFTSNKIVSLTIKESSIFIESKSSYGNCEEEISASSSLDEENFKINFNVEYLNELIENFTEATINMKMNNNNTAFVLTPKEQKETETLHYLIMPVQMRE